MNEIIDVMKKQLELEIRSAKEKLNTGNLDAIFKLTTSIHNLEYMKNGKWESIPIEAESLKLDTAKITNKKYDQSIDSLYDKYIKAKGMYKTNPDQAHRDKVLNSVSVLMAEVYDVVYSVITDSDFSEERKTAQKYVNMLSEI